MQTVSRRGFLGSSAGALGVAALGAAASTTVAAAAGQQDTTEPNSELPGKEKGIRVGMLTAPFGDQSLVQVLDFAKKAAIPCLEVVADPGSKHIDPATFDAAKAEAVKQMLAERKLEITGLDCFQDACQRGATEKFQAHARKMVDAAVLLGVPTLCMQTGMPLPNMRRIDQIKQVVSKVYGPIVAYAKDKGIRSPSRTGSRPASRALILSSACWRPSRMTTSASTTIPRILSIRSATTCCRWRCSASASSTRMPKIL